MAESRDVILTAFACSSIAPCSTWAKDMFKEEPIVLCVPGTGSNFIQQGQRWAATGDAFRAALRELAPKYKDVTIRRRGLVTFSAGWQLGHHILLKAKEQQLLDAYVLEDGLHNVAVDHWVSFATRAANMDAWMAMAHSRIKPPFVAAKVTNSEVFRRSVLANEKADDKPKVSESTLPTCMSPTFREPVRITVPAAKDAKGKVVSPGVTKVWHQDPLADWENRGNLYRFEYDGDDRPDHIYIAQHVAPRLWRLLADHWNSQTYLDPVVLDV